MLHLTSAEEATSLAQRALEVIENEIGQLPKDSPLLDDFLFLIEHRDSYVKGLTWEEGYDFEELRTRLRREVGSLEMAKRIVGLSNVGELSSFKECLELLKEGGVSQASIFADYDQQWGEPLNRTRKLFEFAVAAGVRINGNLPVAVAGKDDQSQSNPDVLVKGGFTIQGIACKVVSGQSLQTLIESIECGSFQVSKAACDKGIVALDVRHRLDGELLFPKTDESTYRTIKSHAYAEALVQQTLADIADEVLNATTPEWRQKRFEETNCKAFMLVAQSCAVIDTEHGPVPTLVGKGSVIPIVNGEDPELDDALALCKWIGDTVQVTI